MTLGVGLQLTAVLFTVVFAGVLAWQLLLRRYVPFVYWLTVVVVSVTGTAAGDWILELTGWGPGVSVLLPAGLIVAVIIGWRLGANATLAFWLAYILTRPLGANLGDWMGFPIDQQGLGIGVALTSVIFLAAILATVIYLTVSRADVIETEDLSAQPAWSRTPAKNTTREHVMLGYLGAVALLTAGVLVWASAQPHAAAAAGEEGPATTATLAPGQSATAGFPASDVAKLGTISQDILDKVKAGDQAGAVARATDLETAWDAAQPTLQPLNPTGWSALDGRIDAVLTSVRAASPDSAAETDAVTALLQGLSS